MQSPSHAVFQNAAGQFPLLQDLSAAESAQICGGYLAGISDTAGLPIYTFGNIPTRSVDEPSPTVDVDYLQLSRFVERSIRVAGPFTNERSVQVVRDVFQALTLLQR